MQLPVLTPSSSADAAQRQAIARDLAALCRGQVRFGLHDRLLYATDASMYQVEPIGVVVPADPDDATAVIEYCGARGVAMLPRGGGTSLAGQCTSHAVVLDLSSRLRAISSIDIPNQRCSAEPGVVIDQLNAQLARENTGLFFAPDPATVAQATVGGCIGNNAAGSRSVLYGRTSENLLALDVALATGRRLRLHHGAGAADPAAKDLALRALDVVRHHADLIRQRFPKTLRQNAGYGLDRLLKQLDAGATPDTLDLAQLLAGSEGTLAVTLGATLRLRPVPKDKGLALLAFPAVDAAIDAVVPILATKPSAVELVDDVVIEAALNNRECRAYVDAFPRLPDGRPAVAVLYVEYHILPDSPSLADRFDALARAVGPTVPTRRVTDAKGMNDAWKLRKAGEPLLHGLPGKRKPITFVEDNAVPPERLAEFVRRFRDIVQREGTRAAFWAHASVGVLHIRPLLDPHDPDDQLRLKRIAVEAADLAKDCGGVMSGEHGDGRVRGPLLPRFFGPELMAAFAQIKAVFDPNNLLNPGNIVAPGPIDSILHNTRAEPAPSANGQPHSHAATGPTHPHPATPTLDTFFDYADQDDFDHAVHMCNGAGVCRKTSGGTMCPSFRGTLDERHSTRGRGNALRLAITGQLTQPGQPLSARFSDPDTIATLDLCLSCKACKSECPSNVDIARLKAEFTAQRHKLTGKTPLRARLIGHVRELNRLGSLTPGLANFVNNLPPVAWLLRRLLNVHPRRSLPPFTAPLPRVWDRAARSAGAADLPADAPRVALFNDCFTGYNESHIGAAAARVLARLGWRPELIDAGCCGRSMISVGMLPQAIDTIDATLARLAPAINDPAIHAILFTEPSCLSALKDDWLQLKLRTPIDLRRRLAEKSMLIEEFLAAKWDAHPRPAAQADLQRAATAWAAGTGRVLLHAHCHQKALWGAASSSAILAKLFGPRLRVLDTGCCGMAGSFGYDADKFDLSYAIADLPGANGGLLPHLRDAQPNDTLLAVGTSCRHQVKDAHLPAPAGDHRRAVHPVQLIDLLAAGAAAGR